MASRDRDILAAEYVLGSLSAADRARAEKLAAHDAEFAAAVAKWETRIAPLGEAVPPVEAPPALRQRIEAALGTRTASGPQWSDDVKSRIQALQHSLAAWRIAAVGAAAAAAMIALAWFGGLNAPLRQAEPPAKYVAMLQGDKGDTGFVVTFDMKEKTCAIRTLLPDLPKEKAYELWALLKNGKAPMSLGLVGTSAYAMVDMPTQLDPQHIEKGVRLAISLEPPSGAPSAKSMGKIVYAGDLIKLTP
jgi:anti-sigma-K factor RskA